MMMDLCARSHARPRQNGDGEWHRSHDFLTNPPLAIEPTTGEVHLRHHISPNGFYRGRKVVSTKGE